VTRARNKTNTQELPLISSVRWVCCSHIVEGWGVERDRFLISPPRAVFGHRRQRANSCRSASTKCSTQSSVLSH